MKKNSTLIMDSYYRLVVDMIGDIPNAFVTETFKSKRAAEMYWKKNYKNRNRRDGHDIRWRKTPLRIERVTTIKERFF